MKRYVIMHKQSRMPMARRPGYRGARCVTIGSREMLEFASKEKALDKLDEIWMLGKNPDLSTKWKVATFQSLRPPELKRYAIYNRNWRRLTVREYEARTSK